MDGLEAGGHPVLDPQTGVLATASDRGLAFFDFNRGKELAFVPFKNETVAVPNGFLPEDGWMTGGKFTTTLWPMRGQLGALLDQTPVAIVSDMITIAIRILFAAPRSSEPAPWGEGSPWRWRTPGSRS